MRFVVLALAAALAAGCTARDLDALGDALMAAGGSQGPYYSTMQPQRRMVTCTPMGVNVVCY